MYDGNLLEEHSFAKVGAGIYFFYVPRHAMVLTISASRCLWFDPNGGFHVWDCIHVGTSNDFSNIKRTSNTETRATARSVPPSILVQLIRSYGNHVGRGRRRTRKQPAVSPPHWIVEKDFRVVRRTEEDYERVLQKVLRLAKAAEKLERTNAQEFERGVELLAVFGRTYPNMRMVDEDQTARLLLQHQALHPKTMRPPNSVNFLDRILKQLRDPIEDRRILAEQDRETLASFFLRDYRLEWDLDPVLNTQPPVPTGELLRLASDIDEEVKPTTTSNPEGDSSRRSFEVTPSGEAVQQRQQLPQEPRYLPHLQEQQLPQPRQLPHLQEQQPRPTLTDVQQSRGQQRQQIQMQQQQQVLHQPMRQQQKIQQPQNQPQQMQQKQAQPQLVVQQQQQQHIMENTAAHPPKTHPILLDVEPRQRNLADPAYFDGTRWRSYQPRVSSNQRPIVYSLGPGSFTIAEQMRTTSQKYAVHHAPAVLRGRPPDAYWMDSPEMSRISYLDINLKGNLFTFARDILCPEIKQMIEIKGEGPSAILAGSRGGQETIKALWHHCWRGPSVVVNMGLGDDGATQSRDGRWRKPAEYLVENIPSNIPVMGVHCMKDELFTDHPWNWERNAQNVFSGHRQLSLFAVFSDRDATHNPAIRFPDYADFLFDKVIAIGKRTQPDAKDAATIAEREVVISPADASGAKGVCEKPRDLARTDVFCLKTWSQ